MKFNHKTKPYWISLAIINAIGIGLTVAGAMWSLGLYILGCVCLLPGSFVAYFLPWHFLWFSDTGIAVSDLLFLPVCVFFNIAFCWMLLRLKRRHQAALASGQ
jgi:uncharacterized membrane protein